jgi:hypothetical protein
MSVRSCRVTIRNSEGIDHTAEVTAASLYEAVALGLRAIRESSWVEDIAQNVAIRVLVKRHSGRTQRGFLQAESRDNATNALTGE